MLEVRTADKPGVIHAVCRALARKQLSVRSMHVTTLGPQAVDVFYVQEPAAGALSDCTPPRRPTPYVRRSPTRLGWTTRLHAEPGPDRTAPDPQDHPRDAEGLTATVFATLSDRLADTFKNLRGKGRLSEADIDATAREIRIALLEADVALPVVKEFVAAVKERARGEEVSGALNPAQQIVKIVDDELVTILGGETRRLRYAKNPPTVIMLAGLQGAGKTTLAAKLALWLKDQGKSPMLVAADLQRPNAVTQLQVNGQRAGVTVFAPEPGNAQGVENGGDPVAGRASLARGGSPHPARRRHRRHRRTPRRRRRADAAGRGHPRRRQRPTRCCSSSTR